MTDFIFKTEPYDHQRAAFLATRDDREKAVFWEMGLGKSWLVINTAAGQHQPDRIDALRVLAPAGSHRNGTDREIPKPLPPTTPWSAVTWRSSRMSNTSAQRALA